MIKRRNSVKSRAASSSLSAIALGLFAILTITLIGFPGCSKKDEPTGKDLEVKPVNQIVPKRSQAPKAIASDENLSQSAPPAATDPMTMGNTVDKGSPCNFHVYHIPPGNAETLHFGFLLEHEKMREINPANLTITTNNWEEYQVIASISTKTVENVTVSFPVWTVDGGEYLREIRSRGMTSSMLNVGKAGIIWRPDNSGVVIRINNHGTAEDIGKYTEEEIQTQLGGEIILNFKDTKLNRNFSFALQQGKETREFKILVVELNVSTPTQGPEKPTGDKSLYLQAGEIKWILMADYSLSSGKFIIRGPAHSPDCYEQTE